MITDKKFPLCSKLGVLRKTTGGTLVISTSALNEKLGWATYQKFLPYMTHTGKNGTHGYAAPASCERFLESINGNT